MMRSKFTQNQKFLQKLALTPQMRQSIQLLGMATKDLNEFIDKAVEANPFLKKEYQKPDIDKYRHTAQPSQDSDLDAYDYLANIPQQESPREIVISQIKALGLEGKELEIAEYLVYEMDENGYITSDLDEAAENFSVEVDEIEKVLSIIQGLEPAGIGARNVHECLQLQLKRQGKGDSLEHTIVTGYMNELAANDIAKIARSLIMDKQVVQNAINNIKKLTPRPASNMFSKASVKAIPDLIAQIKDRKVSLTLNKEWMPVLGFFNPYEGQSEVDGDPQAKEFIKDKMSGAKTLMDNLKRREDTISKVTEYVLNFQLDNLSDPKHDLKSLTISDVAKALSMHASTISRTVSNKYVQINGAVMPLNRLLSKGVMKENGEITSKTAIKKTIETLIKNEDKASPVSDETIRNILASGGIKIERRTVAKYRTALKLLPSHLRKKKTKTA